MIRTFLIAGLLTALFGLAAYLLTTGSAAAMAIGIVLILGFVALLSNVRFSRWATGLQRLDRCP